MKSEILKAMTETETMLATETRPREKEELLVRRCNLRMALRRIAAQAQTPTK